MVNNNNDRKPFIPLFITIIIILFAIMGILAKLYLDSQGKIKSLQMGLPAVPTLSASEVKQLIAKVARHMTLPHEEPKVVSVGNVELLKKDQPFFNTAKNGDKLLVYSQKVILYDPIIDKILDVAQIKLTPTLSPISPIPTLVFTPTSIASPTAIPTKVMGVTSFTSTICGFSFSYPAFFVRQATTSEQSAIFVDPDKPNVTISSTCAKSIARPPVAAVKVEAISIDGVAALLYHNQNLDGSLRDEVIVKHPANGQEINISGFGPSFDKTLLSFKFLR